MVPVRMHKLQMLSLRRVGPHAARGCGWHGATSREPFTRYSVHACTEHGGECRAWQKLRSPSPKHGHQHSHVPYPTLR